MCDDINLLNDVKKCYGNIAKVNTSTLVTESSISGKPIEEYSQALGYSKEEISEVNKDVANLGLGINQFYFFYFISKIFLMHFRMW
jgi:hypothetical protein